MHKLLDKVAMSRNGVRAFATTARRASDCARVVHEVRTLCASENLFIDIVAFLF